MECAVCREHILRAVSKVRGVHGAQVDLFRRTLSLECPKESLEEVKEAGRRAGYGLNPVAEEGAEPIRCDTEKCRALGVELIQRPLASLENGLVRHNPGHLAHELMSIYETYSEKDPT